MVGLGVMVGCAGSGSGKAERVLLPEDFLVQRMGERGRSVEVDAGGRSGEGQGAAAGAGVGTKVEKTEGEESATETELDQESRHVLGELGVPRVEVSGAVAGGRGQGLLVDGMVGQVNGQPIYASRVFQPLEDQLVRWGRELSVLAFRREAENLITAALGEIVFNQLVLAEAMRDLSEQERTALEYLVAEQRAKLIRQWGAGSETAADLALRESKGKTLEEELEEYRQRRLIDRYLALRLLPKINVTRKDIERYYYENSSRFNTPAKRTIRLIRVDDEEGVRRVQGLLEEGRGFVEVARGPWNRYRAAEGGLFGEEVAGDEVFGLAELNQAMVKLEAGQYAGPIRAGGGTYWVYVEKYQPGQNRSLRQVQREIEELLRRQRFQRLTQRYREQLFARGSYNPLNQMAQALVEIAVARYCRGGGT